MMVSCQNRNDKKPVAWPNTDTIKLEGENIKLRVPNSLILSSRYRIKESVPALADNPQMLTVMQNSLESLELMDQNIDVLVDTTTAFRVVIICNVSRIDFNKYCVIETKNILQSKNEMAEKQNVQLHFSKVKAKYNSNGKIKLATFETELFNTVSATSINHMIYYVTGDSYSLIVYEFSDNESDIESFLWTTST